MGRLLGDSSRQVFYAIRAYRSHFSGKLNDSGATLIGRKERERLVMQATSTLQKLWFREDTVLDLENTLEVLTTKEI